MEKTDKLFNIQLTQDQLQILVDILAEKSELTLTSYPSDDETKLHCSYLPRNTEVSDLYYHVVMNATLQENDI